MHYLINFTEATEANPFLGLADTLPLPLPVRVEGVASYAGITHLNMSESIGLLSANSELIGRVKQSILDSGDAIAVGDLKAFDSLYGSNSRRYLGILEIMMITGVNIPSFRNMLVACALGGRVVVIRSLYETALGIRMCYVTLKRDVLGLDVALRGAIIDNFLKENA